MGWSDPTKAPSQFRALTFEVLVDDATAEHGLEAMGHAFNDMAYEETGVRIDSCHISRVEVEAFVYEPLRH